MVATIEAKPYISLSGELNQEAQFLMRQFLETKESDEVWQPVEKTICAGGDIDPWQSDIIPSIFERLSFLHLHPQLKNEGYILLSPSETTYIYQQLYDREILIQVYSFPPFFYGITKPDGLIFVPGKKANLLAGVTEATVCTHLESNEQKRAQLEYLLCRETMAQNLKIEPPEPYYRNPHALSNELGELVHYLRPNELPDLPIGLSRIWRVIFTIPQDTECDFPVEKVRLPFDYCQFRDFTGKWLAEKSEQVFPGGWSCKYLNEEEVYPLNPLCRTIAV